MTTISKSSFGQLSDGSQVDKYILTNSVGSKLSIITYGARIQGWQVPDKKGQLTDIILGYPDAATYEKDPHSFGGIVGRHANRIENASFTINGITYQLEKNDGKNTTNSLHSGKAGFHLHLWQAEEKDGSLILAYHSEDGDGGYPGNFDVTVTYSLSDDNRLSISYDATCDADTICNMTNHAYFNLDGNDGGSILNQRMQIFSDEVTEADDDLLPNGVIYKVDNTPMDLRQPMAIGAHIDDDFQQLIWAGGYDHNWILSAPAENGLKKAAYCESEASGITVTTYTDLPGIQFYAGNFMDAQLTGKKGKAFPKRGGFCLETQYYPNSPAHPEFPQPLLKKGTHWKSLTVYQAGIK